MKACENCGSLNNESYGSGRFCSSKCARGFSTKAKRKEINEKVSFALTGTGNEEVVKICKYCNEQFTVDWKYRNQNCCSVSCAVTLKWKNPEFRNVITDKAIIRCTTDIEKNRLRDIGRKGGFGKKGFTNNGIRYDSKLEQLCFEYLENKKIKFEAHRKIPNSSKISDLYLTDFDIWIELDGIDRERKKKWLGTNYTYWLDKLEIYKQEKLNFIVIKTFLEFEQFINKISV